MNLIGLAQPIDSSPDRLPMLTTVIAITWGSSVHANANWRLSWLLQWITPAGFHHWHHCNSDVRHLKMNHAAVLPLMNRICDSHDQFN
ncbi:MAG: hypothetical protein ACK46L_12410 [Synechococcaceae cyanobacterium]|jgi:sterol desaturase/sphingolipid hydroxylase (fatty acid hydroxylase superfamily)